MKKRILSNFLAICMAMTLFPSVVYAEGDGDAEENHLHTCSCTVSCTAESMNADCHVCGEESADFENCDKYTSDESGQTYDANMALGDKQKEKITGLDRLWKPYQLLNSYGLSLYSGVDDCSHANRNSNNQCTNCGATIYAEYNGVYYSDFKDVIAALPDGSTPANDTIKLLNDVRYQFTVDFPRFAISHNKGCTIDLNGFHLYGSNARMEVLFVDGNVVITDNSSNDTKGSIGLITIRPSDASVAAKLQINADVTVNNISAETVVSGSSYELIINGGIFPERLDVSNRSDATGTVAINGGVFERILEITLKTATLTLSGGEFKHGIMIYRSNLYLKDLLVTGGANDYYYADANGKYLNIADNAYSYPTYIKVCPHTHHQLTDAANYKCVCGTALAVGVIDDNVTKYYSSFQEAITNSDSDTTIQLIKDLVIDDIPDEQKYYNRTLDLNGFKLSKNGSGDLSIGAWNWTITDNSTAKTGEVTSPISVNGSLDIEGGIFNSVYYAPGKLGTISGGTFKIHSSKSFAVRVDYGDASYKLDGNSGYTYVDNNKTYWIDKNSGKDFNYAGSVKPLPITSINANIEDGDLTYGYSGDTTPLMTVSATPFNAGSTITYSWYRAYSASSITPDGAAFATAASCRIPAFTPHLEVGTVYFMAAATCDGYTRYSAPIAVTVVPRTVTSDMFSVADTSVTFKPKTDGTGAGVEQYPVLTTNLREGTDYRFTSGGTEAGANTATVEGMGNYTGTANITWHMDPAVITDVDVTIADKSYNGNTTASVSAASITANGTTVTLAPQDYEASAQFANANVGSKSVSYSFKILNKNYTFANGNSTTTGTTTGTITKGAGIPNNAELYVKNGAANSYSFDLSQLLGTLDAGCSYGNVSYSIDTSRGGISSNYLADGGASIDNDVLTLPIKAYSTDTEGSIGTLYIDIATDNYNVSQAAEIQVIASNKAPLVGAPVLSASTITYGQELSDIVLSGSMTSAVDSTDVVSGTFRWKTPESVLPVGNHDMRWTFTPDDADSYLSASGTISVKVNKAVPAGTPSYTPISASGKKLSDAGLGTGTIQPSGSISWNDDVTTEITRGSSYGWTFTPDDTDNYTILTGSVILWPADSGSSGSGSDNKGDSSVGKPKGTVQKNLSAGFSNALRLENRKNTTTQSERQPFIKGKNGKEGWDVIRQEIDGVADGGIIKIDMNGSSTVPGDILTSISGRDVTIVLDLGQGVSWSVNGRSFTGKKIEDIDFGVTLGAKAGKSIPIEIINQVSGERSTINLTLAHDGEFGFEAVLTIQLDGKNAGLYANLFYYNPETEALEFICDGKIDQEGNAELTFMHASDYIIVISEESMNETALGDVENHTAETDDVESSLQTLEETSDSKWTGIFVLLLLAVLIVGVTVFVTYVKKKKEKS